MGPDPVVPAESEGKEIAQTEASGPSSKQDKPSQQDESSRPEEPYRSSDTSETSSQSDDRSRRPSSDDTKKVCVHVYNYVHVCVGGRGRGGGGGGGGVHDMYVLFVYYDCSMLLD